MSDATTIAERQHQPAKNGTETRPTAPADPAGPQGGAAMRAVWPWAALGAVLLWLAQPPVGLSLVAWVALVPWGMLVARPERLGRRGWIALWISGSAYWLLTMQGVRLAHPALYPGWIVLGLYLGVYPPLFVGLARVMTRLLRAPLWLAIPCVWTGLEWIRSYAFTGFSAALLGHSHADVPIVVQAADLGGTYVVSFVIASVSGAIVGLLATRWSRGRASTSAAGKAWGGLVFAGCLVGLTLGYGAWRLRQADALAASESPLLEAVLIQRDEPLVYTMDPQREAEVFDRYLRSSMEAVERHPEADVVVWPESMYTAGLPYRILDDPWEVPEDVPMPRAEFQQAIESLQTSFRQRAADVQRLLSGAAGRSEPQELLVGCSVYRYGRQPQIFGGAVHIDSQARVAAWYGKMHLVMFGEYIPLGHWFPWLYEIGPLRQGATPGDGPIAMRVAGVRVAPSICFETMVEHVTGNGLRRLARQGESPDLIMNLTNDAWFHGSAILSHHERCSQLVALVNRRPMLMSANQGPTAWIDGSGRRLEHLEYMTNDVLHAMPTRDGRWSLYQSIGDALAWPLALLCGLLPLAHLRHRRHSNGR